MFTFVLCYSRYERSLPGSTLSEHGQRNPSPIFSCSPQFPCLSFVCRGFSWCCAFLPTCLILSAWLALILDLPNCGSSSDLRNLSGPVHGCAALNFCCFRASALERVALRHLRLEFFMSISMQGLKVMQVWRWYKENERDMRYLSMMYQWYQLIHVGWRWPDLMQAMKPIDALYKRNKPWHHFFQKAAKSRRCNCIVCCDRSCFCLDMWSHLDRKNSKKGTPRHHGTCYHLPEWAKQRNKSEPRHTLQLLLR